MLTIIQFYSCINLSFICCCDRKKNCVFLCIQTTGNLTSFRNCANISASRLAAQSNSLYACIIFYHKLKIHVFRIVLAYIHSRLVFFYKSWNICHLSWLSSKSYNRLRSYSWISSINNNYIFTNI